MRKFVLTGLTVASLMSGAAQALPSSVTDAVKGNTQFACELYRKIARRPGNLVLSPFGVSSAMGMSFGAAKNGTAAEMAKVLHFAGPAVHTAMGWIYNETKKAGPGARVGITNRLWPSKRVLLDKFYGDSIQENYHSTMGPTNYDDGTATDFINGYTAKKTQNTIRGIVPKGGVSSSTRMVLTDAIYFRGTWKTSFDPKVTHPSSFITSKGKDVKSKMMEGGFDARYAQVGDVQVLELPFQGNKATMTLVLPPRGGLNKLEQSLSPALLQKWSSSLKVTHLKVSVPRFQITSSYTLASVLQSLGLNSAFKSGGDFSGMGGGAGELYLSEFFHKAYIQINEKGAEGPIPAPTGGTSFTADHSFVYAIRENSTNSILFMGRVDDPTR